MHRQFYQILAITLTSAVSFHCYAGSDHSHDLTIVTDAEQSRRASEAKDASLKSAAHSQNIGRPPREVIDSLKEGNQRFIDGKMSAPRRDGKTRSELVAMQRPSAIVLSCSDSRVPPEVLFDQGIGDIFVIRTAGQVLDPSPIASIEYAVAHLGTRLVVVLGHESCGAVGAALTTPVGTSAGSVDLDKLVAKIKPYIASFKPSSNDTLLRGPVKANASGVARELVRRSEIVRNKLQSQELSLVTAIYSLSTGQVEFNMWELDFTGYVAPEPAPVVKAVPPVRPVKRRRTSSSSSHSH
ncbi:MAG: hypothetical protein RJB13_339 [Pseudomonadota bacterium]